jgi:HAMP domain-containing protein
MPTRKLFRIAVGLSLILLACAAFTAWTRSSGPPRRTTENARRIRAGMSRADVEAILGPPGDYSTGETHSCEPDGDWQGEITVLESSALHDVRGAWSETREDDRIQIDVAGDPEGKVDLVWVRPLRPVDHGLLGNLLWRAKRQWRKWFPEKP